MKVESPPIPEIPVRVITSARRKKTVSARFVGDTIEIRMPEGLSNAEKKRHIRDLTSKLSKKRTASAVDLSGRAEMLAKKYSLPKPTSITWSARQQNRWGSCTPSSGAVRISHRMGSFPAWVIDYVIVHELAHLLVPNHSPEFHALANRFPYCEKAEGFLVAVSLGHAGTLSDFSNPEHCLDEYRGDEHGGRDE